jgi:hypothetical protein
MLDHLLGARDSKVSICCGWKLESTSLTIGSTSGTDFNGESRLVNTKLIP